MKLSISQLLYAGFGSLISIMIIVSILITDSNEDILRATSEMKNDDVPGVILYLQLVDEIGDMQSNALEYLTGESDEIVEFEGNYKQFTDYFNKLAPLESANIQDRERMELIRVSVESYAIQIKERVFDTYDPEKEKWAFSRVKELENTTGKELEELLDKLKEEEFNDALKSNDLRESLKDDLPGVRYYLELVDETGDMLSSINSYIQGNKEKEQSFKKDANTFEFYLSKLKPLEQKPKELADLNKIEQLYSKILETANEVFTNYDPQGKVIALTAVDQLEHELFSKIEKILDKSAIEESKDATRALESTHENIALLAQALAITTPLSAIIGIVIAYIIARSIKRRLIRINSVLSVADQIGAGDLTSPEIQDNNNDEVSKLAVAINQMSNSLNTILSNVSAVAHSVTGSTIDVETISKESSIKSQEQKDKSVMLATAIQEMSATAAEVANQSSSAFSHAQQSANQANEGGKIVRETIKDITELSNSINSASASVDKLGQQSNEIGEIITVITSIAEQTNLLALNAAIEAARAGDAGRGFAVVADEVRNLAARTTQATQQVSNSIGSIQRDTIDVVKQIELGTEQAKRSVTQAEQAGDSLNLIVEGFEALNNMIESIASAAEEQSKTAQVMAQDVTDITNSSSDTAEISAIVTKKSIEMKSLASELSSIVKGFKLK